MSLCGCTSPPFLERITQRSRPERQTETVLKRDLTLFDVTIQGVTHMVGGVILVTTPVLIRDVAGPSLCLGYIISGIVMIFTLLSYMDLSSRYTCIGNAFVYSYSAICEISAVLAASLIIGENMLTVPFLLKGFSATFDAMLLNGTFLDREHEFIANTLHLGFLHFDTIAIASIILVIIINLFPIKKTAIIVNTTVIISIVILMGYNVIALIFGDIENIKSARSPISGRSGMFPYGFEGFLRGTAITVNAYGSVEIINSLAEETINPKRTIPIAFAISLLLVCMLYTVTSFCIAYLQPWYSIPGLSGLVGTLSDPRLRIYQWLVGFMVLAVSFVNSVVSLIGCSRILYKTAVDGLTYKVLKRVSERTGIPYFSVIVIGVLALIAASILTYEDLVNMTSAQQIIIYILVNCVAILMSYVQDNERERNEAYTLIGSSESEEMEIAANEESQPNTRNYLLYMLVVAYLTLCLTFALVFRLNELTPLIAVVLTILAVLGAAILVFIHYKFPKRTNTNATFQCPLMPYTPGLGIFFNCILIGSLSLQSLYAILVSAFIGLFVYFTYGIFNSEVTRRKQGLLEANDS